MARSYQVSVGGTARVAIAGPTQGGGGQVWVSVAAGQPLTVYLDGDAGATSITSSGYPLAAGSSLGPITLTGGETLYGQVTSSTNTTVVSVLRSGKVG